MLNTSLQLAYACAHTCTYINDFGPMMHMYSSNINLTITTAGTS